MFPHNRRNFLKCTAAGMATTLAIAGTKASGRVLGANNRVRVAIAGINGRGRSHMMGFGRMKNVEVAYLVDPDSRLVRLAKQDGEATRPGTRPPASRTFAEALDDKNLDAIAIVTPNHWHTLMAIWACQARQGRVCRETVQPQPL